MKQHIEFVSKIVNPKETQTAKGYLYRFSVPITEMDGEQQITEWLQCAIFLKERDPRILQHKKEFHFTGELKLKKAYGNYPQGLSLFGFEITPVLGKVYRISKPQQNTAENPQQTTQNSPQVTNAPQQDSQHRQTVPTGISPATSPVREEGYRDPVAQITEPSNYIPM